MRLTGDQPGDFDRETTLDAVKRALMLAEKLVTGDATDDDRAAVADAVHPQVRSFYLSG